MTSEDIQHEIERTRDEMAGTLEAIERKLSPRQLMDQAVETMRDLASDQSRVGAVVRENPIPLALIGLGLGWLAISGLSSGRRRDAELEGLGEGGSTWGTAGGTYEGTEYGYAGGSPSTTYATGYGGETAAPYTVTAETGNGGAGSTAADIRSRAAGAAGQAREKLSRTTERTRQRMSQWGQSARSSAYQARDRTWDAFQEHPLTMGVMAALVGAAIGALIPRSRAEAEYMGPVADDMMREAREQGSGMMDKAAQVASRAVDKAKEQGAEALRAVRDETRDEARRQGLAGDSPTSSTMTH